MARFNDVGHVQTHLLFLSERWNICCDIDINHLVSVKALPPCE